MIRLRKADERGKSDFGWLDSRHTFSFGAYDDPRHRGFRSLRVINDDRVAPGAGFGTHGHRDMEILSWVLAGALAHKDSMGHERLLRPGAIQLMRAGTGVTHSEYNGSRAEPVHFLQIWILPDQPGLAPDYAEREVDPAVAEAGSVLLASGDGRAGSLRLHQDADVWLLRPPPGAQRTLSLAPGRHAWVHVALGEVTLQDTRLTAGDGAAVSGETALRLAGGDDAEVLVFDLA